MKLSTLRRMLVLVALGALGYSTGASAATCTTTLAAGSDIQAAITAATAGDVICLSAGIYSPTAKISVSKTITLQGPQVGVDPRPSAGSARVPGDSSTESIIDGSAFNLNGIIVIAANGVVLDGLEVRSGRGDLIDSDISQAGTILRNNIVDDAFDDEGMQIRACTDCLIEHNYVFDIAQDGINMCCGSTGGTIRFNEVAQSNSENAAIYVYDADSMSIQCNRVYDSTRNDGIKLGAKGGSDAGNSGGSILNNTVFDTVQDGITVYMSDTTVEGNDVSYSTSENGAIYVAEAVSNVTIQNNNVHDNTLDAGKWGDPGAIMIGTAVDAATASVNNNNITGNTVNGLTNKAAASLDGKSNWWGATDGPGSPGGSGSGDGVSMNVDFSPYLLAPVVIPDACAPVPSYSCVGFEPPMNLAYLPPALGGGLIARKVKKNKVLPFKAQLVDGDGNVVTNLVAPPEIHLAYTDEMMVSWDVSEYALAPGKSSDGQQFTLAGDKWTFNLSTKVSGQPPGSQVGDPGTYTGTMVSGDPSEYVIDPTCTGVFIIE